MSWILEKEFNWQSRWNTRYSRGISVQISAEVTFLSKRSHLWI